MFRQKMRDVTASRINHVRVAVVCVHRPVARAVAELLEAQVDMEAVGVATTCKEGVRLLQVAAPDVAVIEYQLPDGNAAAMMRASRALGLEARALVLGTDARPDTVVAAAAAGAAGWLPKSVGHGAVVTAIRRVARGEQLIEARQLAAFRPIFRATMQVAARSTGDVVRLSHRQQAILILMLEGWDEGTIAGRFGVRHQSIRRHVHRALARLGAGSLIEGLARAMQCGLLTPEFDPATTSDVVVSVRT